MTESPDVVLRRVKVLKGRAREKANEQNLSENDLVLVRSTIHSLPEYEIEKVVGDPLQFLLNSKKR